MLIVGGGVAGCSLAFSLARRGVAATLVERGEIGRLGASAVGAALLNPYRGRSGKPGEYDLEGVAQFWRLCDSLTASGHDPGAVRGGVLRVASSDRQARAWRESPGLRFLPDPPAPYRAPHGAFLAEDGGWVQPERLLSALIGDALKHDAVVHEGRAVERVERSGARWLAHGERGPISALSIVLCLGAGKVAGVSLPELELVAGDQVALLSDVRLPYPVAGAVYFASTGSRVLVGGNHREAGTEDPRAPQLLRASAARTVPPLAAAPIERVWTGVRAKRPDNVPLLQELEPGLWFLGAFGGRGFLTAPLLADRLAQRLSRQLGAAS